MRGVTPNPEDFVTTLERIREPVGQTCSRVLHCRDRSLAQALWILKVPGFARRTQQTRWIKYLLCADCAARSFWNAMERHESVRVLDETGAFVQNVNEIFDRRRARGIEATDP